MNKNFTRITLLLVAILVTIMQVAAAPVEQDNNAAVAEESDLRSPSVSAQDLWKSLYDQFYASAASNALVARDVEPAQRFPFFPPFPPPPTTFPPTFPPAFPPPPPVVVPPFPPFPPFPPPPTFPPFPPPPTFPPFPPFPPRF